MAEAWTDRSLAAACIAGDKKAIDAFEARYGPEIDKGVAKLDADPTAREELAQQIRERLLVGEPPKLASFDGRGDLLHWLRVVVVRMRTDFARSRGRAAQRTAASPDAGVSTASPADDPEFAHLKAHYGDLLAKAIEAAMVALPDRERDVLRLSTLDGLTSEAIAERYDVSSATVRRWIAGARDLVFTHTRQEIAKRLGVGKQEFASIVRLARSQLDVSIPRLLAAKDK